MIIVAYAADGMKWVVDDGVSGKDFWALYRRKKEAVARQVADYELEDGELTIYSRAPALEFEIIDERLASGCTQYVARPDNWPINNGEPL